MAFTTKNQIHLAKLNGQHITTNLTFLATTTGGTGICMELFSNGFGGSWSGSAGVATSCSESTAGAIYHGGNVSPLGKHLIGWTSTQQTTSVASSGIEFLVDILLYYPSCVLQSTPTTLDNTVTLPRYTNGDGVRLGIFCQTSIGAATPTLTLTYTNSAGTGSRTTTVTAYTASIVSSRSFLGSFFTVPLQGTDSGIRSIDSYTIDSGETTGTVVFVLFKDICLMNTSQQVFTEKAFYSTSQLKKIEDDACLSMLVIPQGNLPASRNQFHSLEFAWG